MRWTCGLGCGLLAACLIGSRPESAPVMPAERLLSEFTNDDGSRPDGRNVSRDDTTALQKALSAGPGVVRIGPGTFQIRQASIPSNVMLTGAGAATILQATDGKPVILQNQSTQWRLRDVVLQGEAVGKWETRTDRGAHGLVIDRSASYEVSHVTIRNFDGAGLQITRTDNQAAGFSDGGMLSHITATENFIGIRFDTRAEYITASHLHCQFNVTGLMIHAGNSNIATSNIGNNIDGIAIADHENGSHGSLTGCLVNHNQRYALWARHVENGMAISNCCFFYGTIRLENSRGVNITSGLISAAIQTEGPDANRIAGNHIIPLQFPIQVAPVTLLDGNFTKEGPWQPKNP